MKASSLIFDLPKSQHAGVAFKICFPLNPSSLLGKQLTHRSFLQLHLNPIDFQLLRDLMNIHAKQLSTELRFRSCKL